MRVSQKKVARILMNEIRKNINIKVKSHQLIMMTQIFCFFRSPRELI